MFQLGARICSDHAPLYRSWGLMEYRAGFPAEAIHAFEKGLMGSPTCVDLYYSCANVLASEVRPPTPYGLCLVFAGVGFPPTWNRTWDALILVSGVGASI